MDTGHREISIRGIFQRLCLLAGLLAAPAYAGTVQYYHTDALGSVVAVTDESGNVVERREYEPYGAQLTPVLADGPGYTGHVQDAATGLTYMQQRYYDPQVGRFLSVDPISANTNTGAGFNRYAYVLNNPYKFTDPDGRCEKTTGSNICGGGGFAGSRVLGSLIGPPSLRTGDSSQTVPAPAAQNQSGATVPDMQRVTLPGLGSSFLDSGMAARVETWSQNATQQGVNLNFNSAFRDRAAQNALRGDPNAITPATTSLHSAGFAVDVNYSSLRNLPGGLTGDQQRTIIRDTATQAGLSWGGLFRTPDPPHFYFDPGGDRRQMIDEASRQVQQLRGGGQ